MDGSRIKLIKDFRPIEEKKILEIDFLYLDLSQCTRCQDTGGTLDDALDMVAKVLETTGVQVVLRKILVEDERQASELGFLSSPTIRLNGRDIQLEVRENYCDSCADLCGDEVDCRVWVYQGREYSSPPRAMIIEAILKEVYGGQQTDSSSAVKNIEVPENLKRFFAAQKQKKGGNSDESGVL